MPASARIRPAFGSTGFSALASVFRRWLNIVLAPAARTEPRPRPGPRQGRTSSRTTVDRTFGGGRKAPGRQVEQPRDRRVKRTRGSSARRSPSCPGFATQPIGDLALHHDRRVGEEPVPPVELDQAEQNRRREVVRQVADDAEPARQGSRAPTQPAGRCGPSPLRNGRTSVSSTSPVMSVTFGGTRRARPATRSRSISTARIGAPRRRERQRQRARARADFEEDVARRGAIAVDDLLRPRRRAESAGRIVYADDDAATRAGPHRGSSLIIRLSSPSPRQ